MKTRFQSACCFVLLGVISSTAMGQQSHPPMRALPEASSRAMNSGPAKYVALDGDDQNDGSKAKPWRNINFAVRQLSAGDTLYLRGGTYYQSIDVTVSGEEAKPITIRGFPNELAVIDGGLREFAEEPGKLWIPFEGGGKGEFVSAKSYPQFLARPVVSSFPAAGWEPFHGKEEQRPVVLGHFADSMVPLHSYRTPNDLRDGSMLWDVSGKFEKDEGVYCGPGLWFNRRTAKIHIRLAHTTLAGLGKHHYRGNTDPRQTPLCISGIFGNDVLRLNGVRNITLQDVVLRGASGSALINVSGAENIVFDGITAYGGAPGLLAKATKNLKLTNSVFRGLAAPWSSRASMKYRGTPSYILITQRAKPENEDWEISNCEFTDSHDGLWVRYVKNLKFHHNYMDNFNDDGLEFGARRRGQQIYVYQNIISRCLLTLTLHEMDADESPTEIDAATGVFITRNIFDLRRGTFTGPPKQPDETGAYLSGKCNLTGDHGGPDWPNYFFYHNTVLRKDRSWRGYYGFGMGGRGTRRTKRRVFNNIFVQIEGMPGLNFGSATDDIVVDGNLHWGLVDGPSFEGDYVKKFGRKMAFRRQPYPEAWSKHDQFADPKFTKFETNATAAFDVRLQPNSATIDAGVEIPKEWFDPLRSTDSGVPDLGAFPVGADALVVGKKR
ncbi:MAG: hypothetical protein CMJ78_03655 [Planctomycetaceae bacterium]|nr:hypothetical protein [Planctomycetaceae bacterium]